MEKSIRGTKNIVVYCTVVVTLVLPWKKISLYDTVFFFFLLIYILSFGIKAGDGGTVQLVHHRLFSLDFL